MSIKKKVKALDERGESKADVHVVIERDECPPDPLHEYDRVFLLHSNIPREFCGNEQDKDYDNPLVEIEDEDGYGTGRFRFRDGVVAFPVSAYIHSGIAFRMGSTREFPCDPGGWDTTPNAAYLWTDRERYERMRGSDWMKVPAEDFETTHEMRDAEDEAEFRKYLWEVAKGELELFQKFADGECFWYREEIRRPFKRVYPDGREVDDCDWEDGNSCGGYYVDSVDDIEFSKDEDVDVFDATGRFVGDEWTIPELVVVHPETELYLQDEYGANIDGYVVPALWTQDLSKAKVFHSWNAAFNVFLKDGKRLSSLYGYETVTARGMIKDKDELK